MTHQFDDARPAVAQSSSGANDLEEIIVFSGFQLLDKRRIPSPAYVAPEPMALVLRTAHIPVALPPRQPVSQPLASIENPASYDNNVWPVTYEESWDEYEGIYRQIDDGQLVVEASCAACLDLGNAGYDKDNQSDPSVAAAKDQMVEKQKGLLSSQAAQRETGVRGKTCGHMELQVSSENQVQCERSRFRGASAGEQDEACGAERFRRLTGAKEASVLRSPTPATMAPEDADRATPPSRPFRVIHHTTKTNEHRTGDCRSNPAVAKYEDDDAAAAQYILATKRAQVGEEWRFALKTAGQSDAFPENSVTAAADASELHIYRLRDSSTGPNVKSKSTQCTFQTPAAKQVAENKLGITKGAAAGNQLLLYTRGDGRKVVYKMLHKGMLEVCRRFSLFDRLAAELEKSGGGRKELNTMINVLRQTNNGMNDVAYFANEHQLADEERYKETMQEMVNGMCARQKSLWYFGVELWNVSQYSEEYLCALNKEAAQASEDAEENEKACTTHCSWHSVAACTDEDDVFQD